MNISTYRHLREYSYEYTPLHIRSVVPVAGKRERFVLYILVPAYCKGEIYTYLQRLLVRERFLLYIPVPTYCEGQICAYFYWCPVRERFVHMFTGVLWKRDLYICWLASCKREIRTYLCQLLVRERFVLYMLVPCSLHVLWESESCIYIFPVSCVRERFVHICASFRWERDLYCTYGYQLTVRDRFVHIFSGVLWERGFLHIYTSLRLEGDLYCIYLYQLTVRERFVHICTSFRWERDLNCTYWYQLTVRKRLFIFVPTYCKREICTYWYQLPVREREICTVLTCTSLL